MDFEEVKTKKPAPISAVTPNKQVKFKGYDAAEDAFVLMEVPSATNTLLRPAVSRSEEGAFALTEDDWDTVCA
jgi:hypothetical protein